MGSQMLEPKIQSSHRLQPSCLLLGMLSISGTCLRDSWEAGKEAARLHISPVRPHSPLWPSIPRAMSDRSQHTLRGSLRGTPSLPLWPQLCREHWGEAFPDTQRPPPPTNLLKSFHLLGSLQPTTDHLFSCLSFPPHCEWEVKILLLNEADLANPRPTTGWACDLCLANWRPHRLVTVMGSGWPRCSQTAPSGPPWELVHRRHGWRLTLSSKDHTGLMLLLQENRISCL